MAEFSDLMLSSSVLCFPELSNDGGVEISHGFEDMLKNFTFHPILRKHRINQTFILFKIYIATPLREGCRKGWTRTLMHRLFLYRKLGMILTHLNNEPKSKFFFVYTFLSDLPLTGENEHERPIRWQGFNGGGRRIIHSKEPHPWWR